MNSHYLYSTIPGEGNYKANTVGRVVWGGKAKILSPDPETGEGEVGMYSRNTFMGYLKEDQKTREAFTEDGVWKSGDLGIMDEKVCSLYLISLRHSILFLILEEETSI